MIKEIVEGFYYLFTGHNDETDDPVPYREKVRGVLLMLGGIAFCVTMLLLLGK